MRDNRQAPLWPGHQPLDEFAPALADLVVAFPALPLPVDVFLLLNLRRHTLALTTRLQGCSS